MAAPDPLHTTIYQALLGDAAAVPVLVNELAPVVRVAVARTLVRAGELRDETELATRMEATSREVFAALFEDGARLLRLWNELGEPSLRPFVRSVAARIAVEMLRKGTREGFTFEPLPAPPPLDGRPISEVTPLDAVEAALAELAQDDVDDEASWEARLRGTLDPEGTSDLAWRAEEDVRAAALYSVTVPRSREDDAQLLDHATRAYDPTAAAAMSTARPPQKRPSRAPARRTSSPPSAPPSSAAFVDSGPPPERPLGKRVILVVVPLVIAVIALVSVRLSGPARAALPSYRVEISLRGDGGSDADGATVDPKAWLSIRALPEGAAPAGVRGVAFARCGAQPYHPVPVTADDTIAVEGDVAAIFGATTERDCSVVLAAFAKDTAAPDSVDAANAAKDKVRVVTARVALTTSP